MKRLLLLIMVILLSSSVTAPSPPNINVEWFTVMDGLDHKVYNISIQNLELENTEYDLSTMISNTNIPIEGVENIRFSEWKLLETITQPTYETQQQWNEQEQEYENIMIQTGTEQIEIQGWKKSNKLTQDVNSFEKEKKDGYGLMMFPPYESKVKNDGTINGTKWFRLEFDTPIWSSGKVGVWLNEWEFHPWWNASYTYKRPFNVTNTHSALNLEMNYTANITIDTSTLIGAGKMQADCDDLRIVYQNTTELNRNITLCNTVNTRVLFQIQANISTSTIDSTNYALYYGEAGAGTGPENNSKVFAYYDDFSVNTVSSYICYNWAFTDPNLLWHAGGEYMYDTVQDDVGACYNPDYSWVNITIMASIYDTDNDGIGLTARASEPGTTMYAFFFNPTTNYDRIQHTDEGGDTTKVTSGTLTRNDEQWYALRLIVNGTWAGTWTDQASTTTTNNLDEDTNTLGGAGIFMGLSNGRYDNIRVMKYLFPIPTYAIGTEESNAPANIPPIITLSTPANNTWTTSTTPDFAFTATDDNNATVNCNLLIDNTPRGQNASTLNNTLTTITANTSLSEASHLWNVTCVDGDGLQGNSSIRLIKIDSTAPATTINDTSTAWRGINVLFTLACTDANSGCNVTLYCEDGSNTCSPDTVYSSAVTMSTEGTRYIRFLSNDSAGNDESVNSQQFKLDKTAPVTTINDTSTAWRNINVLFTLSCADTGGSGCDVTLYCEDGSNTCSPDTVYSSAVTMSTEGTRYIRFLSNDSVSNDESVNSQQYKLDKTAPTTTINDTNDSVRNGPIVWTLSCNDGSGIGCANTTYCEDGADTCTPTTFYSSAVTTSTQGQRFIRFRSNDSLGQLEGINSQEYNINDPATVTLNNPTGIAYNATNITLNFYVSDGTDSTLDCWRTVNNTLSSVGTVSNNTNYIEVLTFPVGNHEVNATCQDDFPQNTTSNSASFSVSQSEIRTNNSVTGITINSFSAYFNNGTTTSISTTDGVLEFFNDVVPTGSVNITVSSAGYQNQTQTVLINSSFLLNLSFSLSEATLTINVFNEITNAVINEFNLSLSNTSLTLITTSHRAFNNSVSTNDPTNTCDRDLSTGSLTTVTNAYVTCQLGVPLSGNFSLGVNTSTGGGQAQNLKIWNFTSEAWVNVDSWNGGHQETYEINNTNGLSINGKGYARVQDVSGGAGVTFNEVWTYSVEGNNIELVYTDGTPTNTVTTNIKGYASFPDTRTYYLTLSVTQDQTLNAYLLNNALGTNTCFTVQDNLGAPIPDVTLSAQRNIAGSFVTIGQAQTDSSGTGAMFLDIDNPYQILMSHATLPSQAATITPVVTSSCYTLTLGSAYAPNFDLISEGVTGQFLPVPPVLSNVTIQNFNFTISSFNADLTQFGLRLYNGTSGALLNSSNVTGSPSGGTIVLLADLTGYEGGITASGFWSKGSGETQINASYTVYSFTMGNYTFRGIANRLNAPGSGITNTQIAMGASTILMVVMATLSVGGSIGVGIVGILVLGLFTYLNIFTPGMFISTALAVVGVIIIMRRLV